MSSSDACPRRRRLLLAMPLLVTPPLALIGIATVFLSVPSMIGAFRYNGDIPRLIPSLGQNVVVNLATPALLAAGLAVG